MKDLAFPADIQASTSKVMRAAKVQSSQPSITIYSPYIHKLPLTG